MGIKYSTGALPPKIRKKINNIGIIRIKTLMNKVTSRRKKAITKMKRDELFLSRDEVQWIFQLTSMQTYELFQLMDKTRQFRIPLLDLWGALILLALDIGVEEKVDYIWALLDPDDYGWLSLQDLRTLIICCTRGLSHIKNIHLFSEYSVDKFIKAMVAFSGELNEKGEISLKEVKAYILMDENARAYFAALGAATVVLDTGMLVKQRREVLQNLAELQKGIKELEFQERLTETDRLEYEKERGGDSSNLRIQNVATEKEALSDDNDFEALIEEDTWGEPTLKQRQRRLQRAKELSAQKGKQMISDAVIFADPNARKKNANSSSFDENSITRKWNTLPSTTGDNLRELDIDLVEDLFEHAGIILTDEIADEYFKEINANALNMRSVNDLLKWYRDRLTTAAPTKGKPPLWRDIALEAGKSLKEFYETLWSVPSALETQRSLIYAIKQKKLYYEQVRQKEEDERIAKEEAAAAVKAAREERKRARKAKKLGKTSSTPKKDISGDQEVGRKKKKEKKKVMKTDKVNIAGDLQGSVRLAAWHRQQLASSEVNNLNFRVTFGHPEDVVAEKPVEEDAIKNLKRLMNKGKDKKKKPAKFDPYKLKIKFNAAVVIPPPEKPSFFDVKTDTINDPGFGSADLLEHFKKQNVDDDGTVLPDTNFGSVLWTALTVAKDTTPDEEHILAETITNFFEAIPNEYRSGTYTEVKTLYLYLPKEGASDDPDDEPTGEEGAGSRQRVLIIALLHESDRFFDLEESMPAGILLTRSMRKLSFQLQVVPSLHEIYEHSIPFESFEDRLFGPQEDELGEEGMNPLRFAKLNRQRVHAATEAIEKCSSMNSDKLKENLVARGLSPLGSTTQLVHRIKKAFQRQADISGFGELSAFGSDMSTRIFKDFWRNKEGLGDPKMIIKADTKKIGKLTMREKAKAEHEALELAEKEAKEPKGLTLWDFNDLLFRTGTETVYDYKEYKSTMESLDLLTDKNYNLMSEGLAAYHEQYGGLGKDMRNLGIGSLDDILKGEVMAAAEYDGQGITSLIDLLEPHSMLYLTLKYALTFLSSITGLSYEADYDRISEAFEMSSSEKGLKIAEVFRAPGWYSGAVHNIMQWMSDGKEGALVSLRTEVHNFFGRYSKFDDVFPEALAKPSPAASDSVAGENDAEIDTGSEAGELDAQTETEEDDNKKNEDIGGVDPVAQRAAQMQAESEKDHEMFLLRLTDLLPPKVNGMDPAISTENLQRLVSLLNTINTIMSNYEDFPLTRDETEGMTLLREETDKKIKDAKILIEESKQLCCAHLCSAFDALRIFADGSASLGWGTKEFCARGYFSGMDFVQYLPKGYGEPCIPQLKKSEKLERAASRKAAAFAALERERMRRNADSEENQEKREAKKAAVAVKRTAEENKLFAEAMDGLVACRYGGKSSAELSAIARIWEKLASMTASRYPDSIKACVHMSNSATALKDMYSVDHFKGKEAIGRLDKAATLAMTLLEEHSNIQREDKKVMSKRQKDEEDEAKLKLHVVVRRQNDPYALGSKGEDTDSLATGSLAAAESIVDLQSEDEGDEDDESTAVASSTKPKEIITLPEDYVLPLFIVFHNYLSIAREANNQYLLNKMERVKRCICGLYNALIDIEAIPLMEKNSMPAFGAINILLVGVVKDDLALTMGELHAIDSLADDSETEEEFNEEEAAANTTKKEEEDADLRRREAETVARRGARRGRPGALGGLPGHGNAGGQLPSLSQEEANAEEMKAKELAAKKAKYARQRQLDAVKRKQTIKQRMKLYHLIDSDKITKIFANKSASVLADGAEVNWGDAEEAEEAEGFLEDSTQATSSDSESSVDSEEEKRRRKEDRKAEKKREKAEARTLAAAGGGAGTGAGAGGEGSEIEGSVSKAVDENGGEQKESKGFLAFLFRNRDTR